MSEQIEALKVKFLEYYRDLPIIRLASGYVGRDEDSIMRWRKQDKVFAEQMALARSEWALRKSKKVKSEEWLLERVMKDHFAPRSEITGEEGKPAVIVVPSTLLEKNGISPNTESSSSQQEEV